MGAGASAPVAAEPMESGGKTEASSLLAPATSDEPIGLCHGLLHRDVLLAADESHFYLFNVFMWEWDRLRCKPLTGDLGPARTYSARWWEYPLAARNPIYWLMWLFLILPFKLLGRWTIRLGTCNRHPSPVEVTAEDTALTVEVKIMWILPFNGFFVISALFALFQAAMLLDLLEYDGMLNLTLAAIGSFCCCLAYIVMSIVYLLALQLKDFRLMGAATAGFVSFAAVMATVATIGLISCILYADRVEGMTWLGLVIALITAPLLVWSSTRLYMLYRVEVERSRREELEGPATAKEDVLEALRNPRAWASLLVAGSVVVVVVGLLLFSFFMDPTTLFTTIG